MKKIYLATLYRYGYDLTVADTNEERAKKILLKEYETEYKKINGISPRNDFVFSDTTYYNQAKEDIEISELELGKVEWK